MPLRFLIIDGYTNPAREKLREAGMKLAWELFRDMLLSTLPDADYDLLSPNDPDSSLAAELPDYDAILWTGTSSTIFHDDDAGVVRMIALGKASFASRTPQFGTCWGVQIAAVAAGGTVAKNPRGREMGIARKIQLTEAGRNHPFMRGKPTVFDAFVSHYDEVVTVPDGATVLAGNAFTGIQALAVEHNGGVFWALQYHPEYDLREMARLTVARTQRLLNENFAESNAEIDVLVAKMTALAAEPDRKDLRWQLAIDDDVLDPAIRQIEFRNFVQELVIPTAAERAVASQQGASR